MRVTLTIALGLVLAAETPAVADGYVRSEPIARIESAPLTTQPDVPPERRWYGGQTLAVDGIMLTSGLLLGSSGLAPLAGISILGYFAGGPMVHGAHDRGWAALGSFGLRLGGPLAGVAIAGAIAPGAAGGLGCNEMCVGGLVAGYLGAVLLDAAALSWERPKPPTGPIVVPTAAVKKDGAVVGLQGVF